MMMIWCTTGATTMHTTNGQLSYLLTHKPFASKYTKHDMSRTYQNFAGFFCGEVQEMMLLLPEL